MEFQLKIPKNLFFSLSQVEILEDALSSEIMPAIFRNFSDLQHKEKTEGMSGGEVILLPSCITVPIAGLKKGISLTISFVTFYERRNFRGLIKSLLKVLKDAKDDVGNSFMEDVNIFVQVILDSTVKDERGIYASSNIGSTILLEYSSKKIGYVV